MRFNYFIGIFKKKLSWCHWVPAFDCNHRNVFFEEQTFLTMHTHSAVVSDVSVTKVIARMILNSAVSVQRSKSLVRVIMSGKIIIVIEFE